MYRLSGWCREGDIIDRYNHTSRSNRFKEKLLTLVNIFPYTILLPCVRLPQISQLMFEWLRLYELWQPTSKVSNCILESVLGIILSNKQLYIWENVWHPPVRQHCFCDYLSNAGMIGGTCAWSWIRGFAPRDTYKGHLRLSPYLTYEIFPT